MSKVDQDLSSAFDLVNDKTTKHRTPLPTRVACSTCIGILVSLAGCQTLSDRPINVLGLKSNMSEAVEGRRTQG